MIARIQAELHGRKAPYVFLIPVYLPNLGLPSLFSSEVIMSTQAPTLNLSNLWMPFTTNRQFKEHPRLLAKAKGMYYTTSDGKQILDGTSGLWCVNAGHGRQEIVDAISRQAAELDYAPSFQIGHPNSFLAATAVAGLMPEGLDRIFFTNSGSESVDTALKIALAYHRARGEGQRTRLIGRERGYHGVGFGGISVGGIAPNRKAFSSSQIPGVDHLPHTHDLSKNRSEERRVGKECVSTCRSRWSPYQ